MSVKNPTIVVVGLERNYNSEELFSMIKNQNNGIEALLDSTCRDEDKKLDIVAIRPLKSKPHIFKAIIRVSNVIRSIISKQNDKIFVGSQRICKVYDSFFVLRCYNCQQYGHHSAKCDKTTVCGFCAGTHETRQCNKKNDSKTACCHNCKSLNKEDINHTAGDTQCPIFIEQSSNVRKSIPFYQKSL